MRHRLDLLKPVREPDGAGGATVSWVKLGSVWAQIDEARAQQPRMVAEKPMPLITHRITIRRRPGITTDMRFRAGTRLFDIDSVWQPARSPGQLVCLVRERLVP